LPGTRIWPTPAIPEFNPDPDAEDGSTTDALVRGLVDALAG
jgi:hypothetical protein